MNTIALIGSDSLLGREVRDIVSTTAARFALRLVADVGEQPGALPDTLMKIADNYDDEVDNSVTAMTSLLEPIMIVFLAVIVGSIVVA